MMKNQRGKKHWTTQTFCHVILLIWKAVIPNCCINIGHVSNSIKNSDEFHTWFVCTVHYALANNIMLCSAFIKIRIYSSSPKGQIEFHLWWILNLCTTESFMLRSVFSIMCSTSLYAHCAHSKSFIISNERWCFVLFSKSLNNSSQLRTFYTLTMNSDEFDDWCSWWVFNMSKNQVIYE